MEIRETAVEVGKYALFAGAGFLLGFAKGEPHLINGIAGAATFVAYRALSHLVNYLAEEHEWKFSSVLLFKSIGLGVILTVESIALFLLGIIEGPQTIADLVIGSLVPISGIACALYLKFIVGDIDFVTARDSSNLLHQAGAF